MQAQLMMMARLQNLADVHTNSSIRRDTWRTVRHSKTAAEIFGFFEGF
jgi:hypothetical protein